MRSQMMNVHSEDGLAENEFRALELNRESRVELRET